MGRSAVGKFGPDKEHPIRDEEELTGIRNFELTVVSGKFTWDFNTLQLSLEILYYSLN